jgi:hypothetical protein
VREHKQHEMAANLPLFLLVLTVDSIWVRYLCNGINTLYTERYTRSAFLYRYNLEYSVYRPFTHEGDYEHVSHIARNVEALIAKIEAGDDDSPFIAPEYIEDFAALDCGVTTSAPTQAKKSTVAPSSHL